MERFMQKYGDLDGDLENKPPNSSGRYRKALPAKDCLRSPKTSISGKGRPRPKIILPSLDKPKERLLQPKISTAFSDQGKEQGRSSTSSSDKGKTRLSLGSSQNEYMEDIVDKWNGSDPKELFDIQKWKEWIQREASDKKMEDKSLSNFAKVFLGLFTDENYLYMERIKGKLDEKGTQDFTDLLAKYDAREIDTLVNNAKCLGSSCEEDSNEDEFLSEPPVKSPRIENMKPRKTDGVTSGQSPCSPGLLFSSPRASIGISKPIQLKEHLTTPMRRKTIANSSRRYSSSLSSTKNRVNRTPFRKDESRNTLGFQNGSLLEGKQVDSYNLGKPTSWQHDAFMEGHFGGADEVIENETPPVSPFGMFQDDFPDVERNRREHSSQLIFETSTKEFSPVPTRCQPSSPFGISFGADSKLSTESNRKHEANLKASNSSNAHNEPFSTMIGGTKNMPSLVYERQLDDDFELPDIDVPKDQNKENFPLSAEEILSKYPQPASAPNLTLDMFEEIRIALETPPKDIVVSGFSLKIRQEDLAIFSDSSEWLIDQNIDFYLELIKERSKQPGYPSVYIFHSFFYPLLTGKDGGYSAVQETTGEDDIFKYDLVFFPVNSSQHWRLVVVQFPKKVIQCFDSMQHDNLQILKNIGGFLIKEYRRKYKCSDNGVGTKDENTNGNETEEEKANVANKSRSVFDPDIWSVENVASDTIPQQKNAIDCGIFCLQYAEYLSRQKEFDFDQSHIRYFRKRMSFETLTKKLLT